MGGGGITSDLERALSDRATVRTPAEFGVRRHNHRSNFHGLSNDVIGQYSLFLTLLTLSGRLFRIQLSLPSSINTALPASSGLHSLMFSLCFLQRSLPVCCHIKQRQSCTPKLKNQDGTHGTKKISTILLYLCLFFLFTSVLLFRL